MSYSSGTVNPDFGGGVGGSLGQNTIRDNDDGNLDGTPYDTAGPDIYNYAGGTVFAKYNWWGADIPCDYSDPCTPTHIWDANGTTTWNPANTNTLVFTLTGTSSSNTEGGGSFTLTTDATSDFVDEVGAFYSIESITDGLPLKIPSTTNRISVKVGGAEATDVVVEPDGSFLTAVVPHVPGGVLDVVVTNPAGQTGTLAGAYTATPLEFALGATSGAVTEAGGAATFTVALSIAPLPDVTVTVAVASADSSEATASPASLTFTDADWDTPQTVTVTGLDDDIDDGDVGFDVDLTTSAPGSTFDAITTSVPLSNADDDVADITESAISGDTDEGGTTATFTVELDTEPTADVTVALTSSHTGEGTVTASLTFTASNWETPQTATVTGENDDVDDGDIDYTIELTTSSSDSNYEGLTRGIDLTNTDDDSAGMTEGAISGDTDESGATATFTVVLDSEPTAGVSVAVASSNEAEGTVAPAGLNFTASDWNTPQTVTVTGEADTTEDGDVDYTVSLTTSSTDANYEGLTGSVAVTNNNVAATGPAAPTLLSPEDGATGLGTDVEFSWEASDDASVSYTLTVCEDVTFAGCTGESVAFNLTLQGLLVGMGGLGSGLFLFGIIAPIGYRNRRRYLIMMAALAIAAMLFTGCAADPATTEEDSGTGDGVTDDGADDGTSVTHTVSGLSAGATYYWKVTATDTDGSTDSEVWSFTTQ